MVLTLLDSMTAIQHSNPLDRIQWIVDNKYKGEATEFATDAHVTPGQVSQWLARKNGITPKSLIRIGDNLRGIVNYEWVVYGTGSPLEEAKATSQPPAPMIQLPNGDLISKEKYEAAMSHLDQLESNVQSAKEMMKGMTKHTGEEKEKAFENLADALKRVFEAMQKIGF